MGDSKNFSDVRLRNGHTLIEEVVRLRELAMLEGVFVVVLGFDNEHNYFAGGHIPLSNENLVKMLWDFIEWAASNNINTESTSPAHPDFKYKG